MDLTTIVPGPEALRALSHPVRLRLLGLLRHDGPSTASALAERLGLNSGATSYHLRQLAQHGFVVDDEARGTGRDRWWRAAHTSTLTREEGTTPEEREAVDAFAQAVAIVHTEQLQAAIEERPLLPREWREASTFSDWTVRLSPARAEQLTKTLIELVRGWQEDDETDGDEFIVTLHAFPRPGILGGRDDESEAAEAAAATQATEVSTS